MWKAVYRAIPVLLGVQKAVVQSGLRLLFMDVLSEGRRPDGSTSDGKGKEKGAEMEKDNRTRKAGTAGEAGKGKGEGIDLAPNIINCQYARRLNQNDYRYYECRNTVGTFAHKMVCQAYCARCKNRVPMIQDREAVMEKEPQVHQTTLKEWLGGYA
jgi:hypothetical protein